MRSKIILIASTMGSTVLAIGALQNKEAQCKIIKWDNNWDHRQPESLVKPDASSEKIDEKRSTVKRTLYLVRHGQYELNKQNDEEKILTLLGRRQAECTGNRLASIDIKYSNFTVSTMSRAKETGQIIFDLLSDAKINSESQQNIEINKSDLLREGHPIDPVPYNRFKPSIYEFSDGCRIEAAFREFLHRADYCQKEDSHEIIVCHANVIRYFICRVMQNPPESWLRMSLANGSITEVVIGPNGDVSVTGIGDKNHIPANMVTFT